jgi:Domain of unknown function (DUF4913)
VTHDDHDPLAPLRDDVADLQARYTRLLAVVDGQQANIDALGEQLAKTTEQQKKATPAFILRLDDDAYDAELRKLAAWVETILIPYYAREATQAAPWCARWFEHSEAVARLHACWLAWQGLTDPTAGAGATGASQWHRDHLDPMLTRLRAPDGPFTACMTMSDTPRHTPLDPPPYDECVPPPHPD